MKTAEQADAVLENGFKVNFTQQQLEEQKTQLMEVIRKQKEDEEKRGGNPNAIRDYDEKQGLRDDLPVIVKEADLLYPETDDEDSSTLYISQIPETDVKIPDSKKKAKVTKDLVTFLCKIANLTELQIRENTKGPGYYAFAKFYPDSRSCKCASHRQRS